MAEYLGWSAKYLSPEAAKVSSGINIKQLYLIVPPSSA